MKGSKIINSDKLREDIKIGDYFVFYLNRKKNLYVIGIITDIHESGELLVPAQFRSLYRFTYKVLYSNWKHHNTSFWETSSMYYRLKIISKEEALALLI